MILSSVFFSSASFGNPNCLYEASMDHATPAIAVLRRLLPFVVGGFLGHFLDLYVKNSQNAGDWLMKIANWLGPKQFDVFFMLSEEGNMRSNTSYTHFSHIRWFDTANFCAPVA